MRNKVMIPFKILISFLCAILTFSVYRCLYAPFPGTDSIPLFLCQIIWICGFHTLFCFACRFVSNKNSAITGVCSFISLNTAFYAIKRQIAFYGMDGVQNVKKYELVFYLLIGFAFLLHFRLQDVKFRKLLQTAKTEVKPRSILSLLGYGYFVVFGLIGLPFYDIGHKFRHLFMYIHLSTLVVLCSVLLYQIMRNLWPIIQKDVRKGIAGTYNSGNL